MPPKWIVEPQDRAILENQPSRIPCQAHGVPTPAILWFRMEGETQLQIHSTSKMILQKDGSFLLTSAAKSDEGLLVCRASNGIGSALSKTIRIAVHCKKPEGFLLDRNIQSISFVFLSSGYCKDQIRIEGDTPDRILGRPSMRSHWGSAFDDPLDEIRR